METSQLSTQGNINSSNSNEDQPQLQSHLLGMVVDTDISAAQANANEEMKEILKHISVLQTILTAKPRHDDMADHSDSLLYLSRYAFGAQIMAKKKNPVVQMLERTAQDSYDGDSVGEGVQNTAVSPSSKEKKRQLALALATLSMKADRRVKLVNDGAISTIMDLAQIQDHIVTRACAVTCSHLSAAPELRGPMIDAGMITALGLMSSMGSTATKVDCANALCNLTCHEGGEARAVKEGILSIIEKIPTFSLDALDSCLKICLNLAAVNERYNRVEDITEALLLFHGMHPNDDSEAYVLAAINNLSGLRANQFRLVEDGALKIIEKTIDSKDDRLRALSAECIRNLSTCNRTRQKLIDNGFINILLNMSRDKLASVRRAAIRSFFQFAKDLACREKVVNAGAIAIVVRAAMDSTNSVETGRVVAKTLLALCKDQSILYRLIKDNVVRALMHLIEVDDNSIRQSCIETLCYLFQDDSLLTKLIDQGAVGCLVALCQNSDDLVTGEWCAYTLYHLTINGECPADMIFKGVLPCLIKLCGHSTARSKLFCAAAFSAITQKQEVDSSCAIPILVHMLRHESDHDTKSDCASALYNLANQHANCDQMLEAGGLLPVVRLTQSDHFDTKIKCAAILSRLSQHEQYYSQFGSSDVLRVLLDLSSLDDMLTRRRVVIALSHLSADPSIRAALMALEETPHCIKMLISLPDEHMRRGCAAIVCNLSSEAGSEKQLLKSGIVPTLLVTALITSDERETKSICLKALVNLMIDTYSYKTMVKEGFIWGLSSLALIEDMEILTMCAKALCNLSRDYAHEMLASSASIKTVMMMINREPNNDQEMDLLKNGCRVLINMLARSTKKDEKFRLLAVESMRTMAKSQDDEICEMFILCLCLASQSEGCRPAMVSSGLLAEIDTRAIFKDSRIGFAYLTMYRNIANDPQMRTELVDDQTVQRFMDIALLRNPELDEAICAALYCISCAAENVVSLTEQDVVGVMQTISEATYETSTEMVQYMVGAMYNLSTCPLAHAKLVQHGFVKVANQIFQKYKNNELIVKMICHSVCHLACGKVNTSMMVKDGAGSIIHFMSENVKSIQHKFFHQEDLCRAAAAYRNLTSIVANQAKLVEQGAIQALVGISQYISTSNKQVALQARRNSAASLKSMTYNTAIREQLVACEAIDIILHDLEKEMENERLTINHELLCDLEAESWENGSRGSIKDGRAADFAPGPIFVDLLTGSNNVQLDVEHRVAPMKKMRVEIELDEPPIKSSVNDHKITITLEDLPHYEKGAKEPSEYSQMIGKMECPVQEISVQELKLRSSDDPTSPQNIMNITSKAPAFGSHSVTDDDSMISSLDGGAPTLSLPGSPSKPTDSSEHMGKENKPNLRIDDTFEASQSQVGSKGRAGQLAPLGPSANVRKGRSTNLKKKFNKLVQAINYAKKQNKKGKGDTAPTDAVMDDVSKEWNKLSRF